MIKSRDVLQELESLRGLALAGLSEGSAARLMRSYIGKKKLYLEDRALASN